MLTSDYFAGIKRTNASKDAKKTKERVKALWKGAPQKVRQRIDELSGVSRQSIYRINKTGAISAKMAAVMAQEFGVSPYYLSGESADKGLSSDEIISAFVTAGGYFKHTGAYGADADEPFAEADAGEVDGGEADMCEITEEEAVVLLKALFIRARAGGNAAQTLCDVMERLMG